MDWRRLRPRMPAPTRAHVVGLTLVFAWVAYPYTTFTLQGNSNDALLSALLVWSLAAFANPLARGALLGVASLAKFAPLVLFPLYAAGERGIRLRTPDARHALLRPFALFTAAFLAGAVLLLAHPAVDPGLADFYDRTIKSQVDRESPFSIWGQAGVEWLQTAVKLFALGLAIAVASVPKRADARALVLPLHSVVPGDDAGGDGRSARDRTRRRGRGLAVADPGARSAARDQMTAGDRRARAYIGPAATVLIGIIVLQRFYDAPVGDSLLYLAHELGLVLAPGWLLYRALSMRPGGVVRQLALGWALGYVVEVLGFMLAGATGTRGVFFLYPLVIGGAAAFGWSRRRRARPDEDATSEPAPTDPPAQPDPPHRWFPWALAAVCVLAVVYVVLPLFDALPLPGGEDARYAPDYPWLLAMTAEAKNHFPIEDANVAGEPFAYHYFVNVHQAAASQITGIELPLIAFRLYLPPLVVALVLVLAAAGQAFTRSLWIGLGAACLALFIGELQLDPRLESSVAGLPFIGVFSTLLYASPSFSFGLVILLALVVLVGERIQARDGAGSRGEWALIAILMVGAFDAKVSDVPVLLVGLAIFAAWSWWRDRRVPGAVWLAGGIALAVSAVYYLLQYRGHSGGLGPDLTAGYDFIRAMPAVSLVRDALEDALPGFPGRDAVLGVGGTLLGIVGLFGPQLVGILWVVRRRERPLRAEQMWLLAVLAAGALALLFLREEGTGTQLYFLFSGVTVGCILSAEGLRKAIASLPEREWERAALIAAGFVAAVALLIAVPLLADPFSGSTAEASRNLLWYGGLLLLLVGLGLLARRHLGSAGRGVAAALTLAIVALGIIDTPVSNLLPTFKSQGAAPNVLDITDLQPELYAALEWIRDETPEDAVIAVDNIGPDEYGYAAFSERRNFLGGWSYATETRDQGTSKVISGEINPFADRFALDQAAFGAADADAVATMAADFGVDYLVVDKANGPGTDVAALSGFGEVVYENEAATVIRLG